MDLIFPGVLPSTIGEKKNAGLFVLSLPGVKEVVGSGEGKDIVRVYGGG